MVTYKFGSNWLTIHNSSKMRCFRCSHPISIKDMKKHEGTCQSNCNPIQDDQFSRWGEFIKKAITKVRERF